MFNIIIINVYYRYNNLLFEVSIFGRITYLCLWKMKTRCIHNIFLNVSIKLNIYFWIHNSVIIVIIDIWYLHINCIFLSLFVLKIILFEHFIITPSFTAVQHGCSIIWSNLWYFIPNYFVQSTYLYSICVYYFFNWFWEKTYVQKKVSNL